MLEPELVLAVLCGWFVLIDGHGSKENHKAEEFVGDLNDFTFDVFHRIAIGNENIVLSGFSLDLALGMLELGAKSDSYTQINEALQQDEIHKGTLERLYRYYINQVTDLKGNNILHVANAACISNTFKIKQEYERKLQQIFHANVLNVDFRSAQSVKTINGWVAENTNNLIPKLFNDPFAPNTALVLLNVFLFHGKWKYSFDQTLKQNATFSVGNSEIPVSMMRLTAVLLAGHDVRLNMNFVLLPYVGDQIRMILLVPNDTQADLSDSKLSADALNRILSEAMLNTVTLSMPKFSLSALIPLNPVLQDMGITDVFNGNADLRKISHNKDLQVAEVLQKVMIIVNENGTEAAAASAVVAGNGITADVPPPPRMEIVADRPFWFMIQDERSGIIYMVGRASEPSHF